MEGLGLSNNGRTLPVYLKKIPSETVAEFPCVFVTYEGDPESTDEATFDDCENIYPIRVFIADRNAAQDDTMRATYLRWRKQMMDAIRPLTSLDGVDECYNVRVARPEPVFDQKLPHYQYVVSGFLVHAICREVR